MADGALKSRDPSAEGDPPPASDKTPLFETAIETVIFQSRWLMAPIYLGLVACLAILMVTFFRELITTAPRLLVMGETEVILMVLTLIDLSLAGNLVLIVLFSGYENFVSKIEAAHGDRDRPSWMGTLDFSGLKIKLIASIVAISGIHLLKVFMNVDDYTTVQLTWLTLIHVTFVLSGIAFATMDWIEAKAHRSKS